MTTQPDPVVPEALSRALAALVEVAHEQGETFLDDAAWQAIARGVGAMPDTQGWKYIEDAAKATLDRDRATPDVRVAARLPRNVMIFDGESSERFEGKWVAVPHEDFMALQTALAAQETPSTGSGEADR